MMSQWVDKPTPTPVVTPKDWTLDNGEVGCGEKSTKLRNRGVNGQQLLHVIQRRTVSSDPKEQGRILARTF